MLSIPLLDELKDSDDTIIAEAATLLLQFTEQVKRGEMSKEEFKQLANDLFDMKRVGQLTNDITRQQLIATTFQQIFNVLEEVGGFLL